jgi:putative transposase
VLESYITNSRNKTAALAFIKKALKRHGMPESITTDELRSYAGAVDEFGNRERQEVGRWTSNGGGSHLPFNIESASC